MEPSTFAVDEPIWPDYARQNQRRFKLVLIDDHPVVREGLAALLSIESDLQIVGDAGNVEDAIKLIRERTPDLVVCDLTMPGYTGSNAVRKLRSEFPLTQILVLSAHCSVECIRESFGAGANGYVRKDAFRGDLLSALRRVVRGIHATCPGVGDLVIDDWLEGPAAAPASAEVVLNPEERKVLRLIALGVPTRRIAEELGRGVKAVEKYRMNLMRRLNLQSTAAIARFAVQCKLLTVQEVDRLVAVD